MLNLELKIPPLITGAIFFLLMWSMSLYLPAASWPAGPWLWVSISFTGVGIVIAVLGLKQFKKEQTTSNPLKPEAASVLVTSGVYRFTRNPMYLGLFFLLLGWAFYLQSSFALLLPFGFMLYMSRFQIRPEEKVLSTLFGSEYRAYRERVRRWL